MPSDRGRRSVAVASPFESVGLDVPAIWAPGDAVKITSWPGTGFPNSSFNKTRKGFANCAPGAPVCASPSSTVKVSRASDAARMVYDPWAVAAPEVARIEMTPLLAANGTYASQTYAP